MAPDLERFFASYAAAFDRLDPEAIAAHYALPSMLCTNAERVVWTDVAAIVENMRQLCRAYRRAGYQRASYETVSVAERGAAHAVVDLLWTVERADGLAPWRFRTGYDVQRQADEWRIVVCVAYEEAPLA
jgi:hypothetical protein